MRITQTVVFLLCSLAPLFAGQTNYPAYTTVSPPVRKAATNRVHAAVAPAVTADDAAINAVMWRFQNAIRTNDFTYAVEVMYAPYLQKMGGRERALMVARAAPAQMQAQHVRFVSWTPLRPYTYVAGKQRRYAVVRFEAVLDAAGRRTKLRSYLLGIRTYNAPWQFVNGDGLVPADFAQFFPDFPKTTPLPKPEALQQ
jgi:hypothetical protein